MSYRRPKNTDAAYLQWQRKISGLAPPMDLGTGSFYFKGMLPYGPRALEGADGRIAEHLEMHGAKKEQKSTPALDRTSTGRVEKPAISTYERIHGAPKRSRAQQKPVKVGSPPPKTKSTLKGSAEAARLQVTGKRRVQVNPMVIKSTLKKGPVEAARPQATRERQVQVRVPKKGTSFLAALLGEVSKV